MVRQADIIAYARTQQEFSRREMLGDFKKRGMEYSAATVSSCLKTLTAAGIIRRIRKGVYTMDDSQKQAFVPYFDGEMQDLESTIRKRFHFTHICIWSSFDIKRFSHYIINLDSIYVDVEREATESVFNFLLNAKLDRQVFLKPSSDDYSYYIYGKPSIIVRPLVSEAPLIAYSGDSSRLALEKLLVDTAVDEDFSYLQEYESLRFYHNALDNCLLNETKLLRYASRRGCRDKIKSLLNSAGQDEILD